MKIFNFFSAALLFVGMGNNYAVDGLSSSYMRNTFYIRKKAPLHTNYVTQPLLPRLVGSAVVWEGGGGVTYYTASCSLCLP